MRIGGNTMNRFIVLPALVTAFVALSPTGAALADNPHSTPNNPSSTGQPNQSLQSEPSAPPGMALTNDNGFNNVAVNKYAGSQPQNSKNPKSVSQYDVAAFQFSNRGP
jgi:hypothetical protein